MNKPVAGIITGLVVAIGVIVGTHHPKPKPVPHPTPPPVVVLCHARGTGLQQLPDPNCTPGVTNPNVTQANIWSTICKVGWTSTIRPPRTVTYKLKVQGIKDYGYADKSTASYEEDHLISLELGGSPSDPKNLWPEYDAGKIPNPKDNVEYALNREVCSGKLTLAQAQQEIATDWTTAK
jgi:hypothetical protein